MQIGTKCSFNKEQLLCSIKKGLHSLEFHTNYSDFNGDIDFSEIREILKNNNVSCHAVHAPIRDSKGILESISIGTFHKEQRKDNIELFKKCIQVANYLCEDGTPIVVSHIGTGYCITDNNHTNLSKSDIDVCIKEAEEDLTIINEYIVENYPNTIFVVENMPSMTYASANQLYSWYFGCKEDLPQFIESLNLTNIKTCLDICHLTTTMRIDKIHNPYNNISLDYYIEKYSKTLGLIHLNNCINLGEKLEWHSQPLLKESNDDVKLLSEFFTAMLKYNVNCPISLEINDVDYLTQANTDKTIECIEYVLENINNEKCKNIKFKK